MRSDGYLHRDFAGLASESDWRRELRIKFFAMLFGVGVAAVAAAALSLRAHHNESAPASPAAAPASAAKAGVEVTAGKRVETMSVDTDRASTAKDVTSRGKSDVATACEGSGVACGNDASVPGKPRVTRLRAANERPAIAGVLVGRGDAPNGAGAGGAWTNVPETPAPATSPRPALEHTKPVASQRSAAEADRPDTNRLSHKKPQKIARSHNLPPQEAPDDYRLRDDRGNKRDDEARGGKSDASLGRNGFWAWSRY